MSIPRLAAVCGLVAVLSAVGWSFVTPPFQVPDEPDHYAYVKQLVDTGSLPSSGAGISSKEILDVLEGLRFFAVRERPQNHTIASRAEEDELQRALERSSQVVESGSPGAGVAASEPPLYYALEAIPYALASGGTVLDRLQLMRLVSALFAGLTAMFAFLFARETLPGAPPGAWVVAGLGVALMPLLGFTSGAVHPDAMLFAVSAAIFYCLARAFRHGFDGRSAVALGALTATGFLTKLNFIGLAPGILFGVLMLSRRVRRLSGPLRAYRLLALASTIALSPVVLYIGVELAERHPALGIVSSAIGQTHGSLAAELSYIWQLYLPRLPGTANDFPGLSTTLQLWFRGYVGFYGWYDTTFPAWVDHFALIPAGAIALLCGRALLLLRATARRRAGELATYAIMGIGLLTLVGVDSYLTFPRLTAEYAQVRYLLPLLPLFGVVLALAARGAGRRWWSATGALIVVLALAHDVFSQLLVISRYYG